MAIGGPLKGNSSSNRGRPYGMMLLLAFGAAIFGVMVLHKLRERRIFNLLLKEKDRELISLQLFLQKERDSSKELKRKTEEMKANIYSLRTQKMELDSRLLEMQSTIASLKDEQRTMESALEERQNEIKMMTAKEMDSGKETTTSQVKDLTEILKQKEAEVEDLKRRVELPVNVWSVSTDDPSNPPVNLTARGSVAQKDGTEGIASKEDGEQLHGSTEYKDGDNSTRGKRGSQNESSNHEESESSSRAKDGSENGQSVTDRRVMTGEERLQKPDDGGAAAEKSLYEVQGKKNEDSQNEGSFGLGEEKKNATADEATGDSKIWKGRGEDTNIKATMNDKEHGDNRDGQMEKRKISVDGGGGWEFGTVSKGGMKLEMSDGSQNGAGSRVRGKHGNASKTRGKRWRMIAKNRGLEHNGDSENMGSGSMRSRRFFKAELESERFHAPSEKEKSNGPTERKGRKNGKDNQSQVRKAVISSEAKLTNPKNPEEVNDLRNEVENADTNHQVEKYGNSGKLRYSLNGDVSINRRVNGEAGNVIGDAGKQKLDEEARRSDEQEAGGIQQTIDSRDVNKVENVAEQVKVGDEDEELEDLEVSDIHEEETDEANNGDAFREFNSNMEEDKEEYMEETDESEF